MELTPGTGLEKIKFGMTEPDIIAMLGEPSISELIEYSPAEKEKSSKLYYHNVQIYLTFDFEDEYKLGTITIVGHGHTLFGRDLYNLPLESVKRFITKKTGEIPKYDDCTSDENSPLECLEHDGLAILFWFKSGNLERMECSYFFEPDGETIIWPTI